MVSARRQKRMVQKKRPFYINIVKYLVLLLVFVSLFIFVKLSTKEWNGEDKVSFAYTLSSGDIGLTVLDPKLEEITTFIVPGDTEVEVARGLGSLKVKNVWQLGVNEKLGGSLLTQTITKDFLFPVYLWSNDLPNGISNLNLKEVLRFIFLSKNTNISFGDRLSIGVFVFKAESIQMNEINLGKSLFLVKSKLSDGSLGYEVPSEISERLTFYFSDSDFSDSGIRVHISDATGAFGVSERVGKVLEVMGAKVVSIEKLQLESSDCEILGGNKIAIEKISKVFDCKKSYNQNNSDIEIKLGGEFAKKF